MDAGMGPNTDWLVPLFESKNTLIMTSEGLVIDVYVNKIGWKVLARTAAWKIMRPSLGESCIAFKPSINLRKSEHLSVRWKYCHAISQCDVCFSIRLTRVKSKS